MKAGWRICGVQVTAELDNPTVDSMLLTQVDYTSGIKSGSAAAPRACAIASITCRAAAASWGHGHVGGKSHTSRGTSLSI